MAITTEDYRASSRVNNGSIAKTWDKYMEDVRIGRPGAQEALDEFRAYKLQLVTKVLKARLHCFSTAQH